MIIVLINWRVQPSMVDAFMDKWKTGLRLGEAKGLVGEFLSRVEDATFATAVTWELEPDEADDPTVWRREDYVSYVNVGIWESYEAFFDAVGKYMTSGRTIREEFEAAPRRRAILTPEHWRRGTLELPLQTSDGVLQ